jgi:hypothetical protein
VGEGSKARCDSPVPDFVVAIQQDKSEDRKEQHAQPRGKAIGQSMNPEQLVLLCAKLHFVFIMPDAALESSPAFLDCGF